ncbi:2-hydroxyacid dehydrogenase [Acetobacterium sp.]|uniref:2-hydroxyacid dehydrogenase n=1 Tax=Acetobacterium sp. TaxID=1872094 RepID=UPI000CC020B5|nr:NAD(P)-dependent oxidoreductase [Acetobacterium sp.]MDO9493930.1 NAD(P)-dependent oxidoreductase [Acetobacterium sp.]PKM73060.1 MAG: GyaR protein [Firmicutes bacterium HGW-Firmicutes-17]
MTKVLILTSTKRMEKFSDLSGIPTDWQFIFGEDFNTDEAVLQTAGDADFIFADAVREVSKTLINNMPNLKLIHSEGVGYNKIDIQAAKEKKIYVCNNTAANSAAVAEQTILLMLSLQRRLLEGDQMVRSGQQIQAKGSFIMDGIPELGSSHVGLVGMGSIALETAKRLKPFGTQLSYFNRSRKSAVEHELGLSYLPLEELCMQCDIISLHLPVTPETTGLINAKLLSLMKPSALLINTARGELVVQEDLVTALSTGQIAGAGLDTLYPEPVMSDNPLLNLPESCHYKLLFSPHIGGTTKPAFEKMHKTVWANILAVSKGVDPINIVNGL